MSTELLLLGFIRATATDLVKQVDAPALFTVVGKTAAGVTAPLETWPPGLAGLQLQNEVLRRLHDLDAVLPARAGTIFASEDDLQDLVARYNNEIGRRLDLVAGKVELGIELWTADGHTTCDPASGPGRQYLLRLGSDKFEPGPVGSLCANLHQRLAEVCTNSVRQACLRPNTVFRASYLVPRDRMQDFKNIVAEGIKGFKNLGVFITGPWPPYSFSCLELNRE
ncbi:MAG: GvpL/GvpF family gas vesicle protein [Bacillota bacterium]